MFRILSQIHLKRLIKKKKKKTYADLIPFRRGNVFSC